MNKAIDITKPVQLDDGTPATFLEEVADPYNDGRLAGLFKVEGSFTTDYFSGAGSWNYYLDTGEWVGGGSSEKRLQNVPEVAPKIDWTKPIETVAGQPVELLPEKSDDGEYWRVRFGGSWGVRHYSEDGKHRYGGKPDIRNVAEVPAPVAPALDLTKPLQTRDGRSVVLITSEGRGKYPVLGYVGADTGPKSWTSEGKYQAHTGPHDEDLVNVEDKPAEIVVYACGYISRSNPTGVPAAINVFDGQALSSIHDFQVKLTIADGKVTAAELV